MARRIRGNTRVTTAVVTVPDAFSVQAASLGVMTNTYSPASRGRTDAASPAGYAPGHSGYGVNRWAGRTTYPLQHYATAVRPVSDPVSMRLGLGAGVAGQPGLPNTGGQTGGLSSLAWLSYSPLGRAGLGG
jgi:hypothetical protein